MANGSFDVQIMEIPVDDIKIGMHIKNIRTVFNEESIRELADSIHRDGLQHPLTIMQAEDENGNECIELVAGERRLRAIRLIMNTMDPAFMDTGVPAIQYTGTVHDAEFVGASENIDREGVDDVDVAAWLYRRCEEGVTQSELAGKLHRKLQWVNSRVTFAERSCEELKQALRDGVLSFSAAYELAKKLDHEDQKAWVKKAKAFNRKISLEEAQRAGKADRTQRPGKKDRDRVRDEAKKESDTNPFWRGVDFGLRWVDGLLSEAELHEAMTMERAEQPAEEVM